MKMNKYFKRLALGVALAASAGLSLALFSSGNSVQATTTIPATNVVSAGIAKVPTTGERLDGKYSTFAKVTAKTQVRVSGDPSSWTRGTIPSSTSGTGSELVLGHSLTPSDKGKIGVIYTNVASVNGRPVDLQITATDWEDNEAYVCFPTVQIALGTYGSSDKYINESTQFVFQFLDHVTHQPVQTNGYFTFNDIDSLQGIGFNTDTAKHIDKVYVPTKNTIVNYAKKNGQVYYSSTSDGSDEKDPKTQFTILYSGLSSIPLTWSGSWSGNHALDVNGTFSTSVSLNYGSTSPSESVTKTGFAPNSTISFMSYIADKPLRTATVTPAKTVSDSDEKKVVRNTLESANETNIWQITQVVPDEESKFYYTEAYLTDNIDPAWTVNSCKVTNENGADVTSWFNNQGAGNGYKLAATAAKLKSADFYGHTYTFTFNAKLKKGYDLSKYLVNGGYTFTNQGTFTTDTGTKPTNTVTTLLKEEQLTLHKIDDDGKALSGVKFALADTEANAKGGKFLKKDAKGNVVYPSDSNYSASLADYIGTTDTNGNVTWKGLSSAKDNSHSYYFVELQTSSNHQLLTSVGIAKASATGVSTTVTNKSKVHLPETGSSEQLRWELATLVIGVTVIVAGSGLYAIRKAHKN